MFLSGPGFRDQSRRSLTYPAPSGDVPRSILRNACAWKSAKASVPPLGARLCKHCGLETGRAGETRSSATGCSSSAEARPFCFRKPSGTGSLVVFGDRLEVAIRGWVAGRGCRRGSGRCLRAAGRGRRGSLRAAVAGTSSQADAQHGQDCQGQSSALRNLLHVVLSFSEGIQFSSRTGPSDADPLFALALQRRGYAVGEVLVSQALSLPTRNGTARTGGILPPV